MEVGKYFGGAAPHFSQNVSKKARPRKIGFLLLAWLISACTLFGEIMPFGAALYAAEYITLPPLSLGVVAILAILFPSFLPAAAIKYAIALILFSLITKKYGDGITKVPLRRGGLMGGCVFAAGLFMLLGGQILIYDCFLLVLEAGITCAAVCLFANARTAFSKNISFSAPADVLSVSALAGVAILGISNLFGMAGLHLTVPLSVLVVLLLTHESGMTSGATAGITLGLLATLESGNPVLGAFAVSGMAAGYFSRFGRAGAALAFICANAAITFYTGGTAEMVLHISEVLAPCLVYLALPPGLLGRLTAPVETGKSRHSRTKSFLCEELREKAQAFSYLACTFTDISENKLLSSHAAAASFFEKTARHACEGCKKLSFCWKKEFHRTYASFFVMLEICSKEGKVSQGDIPISLEEKCIRPAILLDAFNHMYEVYKIDTLWETRMQEARLLVARQLSSVAHILEVMEKNVKSGLSENNATEDLLRAHLSEKHIPVRDITVMERRRGALSVTVTTEPGAPPEPVAAVISEALGSPMEITSAQKGHIRLSPAHHMHLAISGETVPRDGSGKSGDSFDSIYLENGCYLLAISDGMGSGERAGLDSRAAVGMLRALFAAGFDAETAVGLVNSILVLKSAEETFATLDLLLVNTRSFEAEFIKAGAAASFIKRGNAVRTFAAGSLPAGMLASPDAAKMQTKVSPGDMIVMLSDGIADPKCQADNASWVADAIRSYEGNDPRALSQIILQLAKEKGGGKIQDDMTVLCAAVHENDDFVA